MERAVGRQAFIQDKKLVQECCGTSGPTLGPVVESMIITFGGSPPPPPDEEPTRGLTRDGVFDPDTLYVILTNAFGNIVAPDGTIIPVDILGETVTYEIPGILQGDQVKLNFATVNTILIYGAVNNVMDITVYDIPEIYEIQFTSDFGNARYGPSTIQTIIFTEPLATLVNLQFAYVNTLFTSLDVTYIPNLITFYVGVDKSPAPSASGNNMLDTIVPTIEYLTKLESLSFMNCKFISLDVSGLSLQIFKCSFNQLTTVILPTANTLTNFICRNNENLTIVDITGYTKLEQFLAGSCNFSGTLDVSANTGLEILDCGGNPGITGVNITGLTSLRELSVVGCTFSPAGTLDVSANTGLEILYCVSNPGITGVNITGLTSLRELSVGGCTFSPVGTLDVSANTGLEILSCSENTGITGLIISGTSLTDLNCNNTGLDQPDAELIVSALVANGIPDGTLTILQVSPSITNPGTGDWLILENTLNWAIS
jgi:hypothetical protein